MPSTPASRLSGRSQRPEDRDDFVDADPASTAAQRTYDREADDLMTDDASPDDDDAPWPSIDDLFPLPAAPIVDTADPTADPTTDPTAAVVEDHCGVSPQGTLLGDAAHLAQALADAEMPGALKSLALHLFVAIYQHQPKHWPPSAPPPGAYHAQVRELAREFDDSPGNLSTRLKQLIEWQVLGRGTGKYVNVVWFRPVVEWSETLFDRAAARARHRRLGAGAPARVRAPNPTTPLSARASDVYHRAFITREVIVEALGATRLARIDDVWPVIEHFQRSFDEAFRVQWLPQLLALLDAGRAASLIIATASEIKYNAQQRNKPVPYRPWGYLTRCLANAPDVSAALTPSPVPSPLEKGPSAHARSTARPTSRPADAYTSSTDPTDADPLTRAQERTRRRFATAGRPGADA